MIFQKLRVCYCFFSEKGRFWPGKKTQRFGCTIPVMINMLLGYSCHNSRIMSLQGPIKKDLIILDTFQTSGFLMVNTWKYRGIWRSPAKKRRNSPQSLAARNISSALRGSDVVPIQLVIRVCCRPWAGFVTWWHGCDVMQWCAMFFCSKLVGTGYIYIYGYGSIPISTIFSGMNIHLPAILMWTTGVPGFWHTAI